MSFVRQIGINMDIAVLTFNGFNELDSFIVAGILNRMKDAGWNVQITSPSQYVTSMTVSYTHLTLPTRLMV